MFDPAKIERIPDQTELYYWADYVEVRCLTDIDKQYSLDRLLTGLKFADDLKATDPAALDSDLADVELLVSLIGAEEVEAQAPIDLGVETGPSVAPDELEAPSEFGVDYDHYGRAAEVRDSRRRWMEDVFRLLQSRAAMFGDIYPFEVASDSLSIELRERTDERLAYVFYLGCSSLRYVDKKTEGVLTKLFEAASADVLELLLPAPFVTDLFGTARGKRQSRFSGTLYQRIVALAKELNGKVVVAEVDFHPRDTADNGLDLVAWAPASDQQPGVLSFFGQCACGTGWGAKQSEPSYLQRWHRFIHLVSAPTPLIFIPFAFRKIGGHWYADGDVEIMLVDRLRALKVYAEQFSARGTVPLDLVASAWDFNVSSV